MSRLIDLSGSGPPWALEMRPAAPSLFLHHALDRFRCLVVWNSGIEFIAGRRTLALDQVTMQERRTLRSRVSHTNDIRPTFPAHVDGAQPYGVLDVKWGLRQGRSSSSQLAQQPH